MDKTKKIKVVTRTQARLNSREASKIPSVSPRIIFTVCVKGRKSSAIIWVGRGSEDSGKNVPLNKNIGVIRRKAG